MIILKNKIITKIVRLLFHSQLENIFSGPRTNMQLVVPATRIKEVLREIHTGSSGARFGINKTLSKVRERFY